MPRLRQQIGQSMIEYTIVLAFGVLTLTTGPMQDVIATLTQRIQDHYTGYSYAVSLSDYPDADIVNLNALYTDQGLPQEMIDYLDDSPDAVVAAINQVTNAQFPDLQDAIDMVIDSNLSPSQIFSP